MPVSFRFALDGVDAARNYLVFGVVLFLLRYEYGTLMKYSPNEINFLADFFVLCVGWFVLSIVCPVCASSIRFSPSSNTST